MKSLFLLGAFAIIAVCYLFQITPSVEAQESSTTAPPPKNWTCQHHKGKKRAGRAVSVSSENGPNAMAIAAVRGMKNASNAATVSAKGAANAVAAAVNGAKNIAAIAAVQGKKIVGTMTKSKN